MLEWNQVFIDTLIATNTPNSSSQRLGAIVHTAIFDAYNGIERRYRPILVRPRAAPGASRRAAVIAAAYTALVGLFPSRQLELDSSYDASLAALGEDNEDCSVSRDTVPLGTRASAPTRGNRASAVSRGARRSRKQCSRGGRPMALTATYVAFSGGPAVGQWRPVAPATAMSAQGLAFTAPFVLARIPSFDRPHHALWTARRMSTTSTRSRRWVANRLDAHRGADGARSFLGRQRKCSLESGSKPDCARPPPFDLQRQPPARGVEHRDGRYGFDHLERQALLWRRCGAGDMAADYRHHAGSHRWQPGTVPDVDWIPLVTTPSHPEYPAGHPSLNGAAASVLLAHFSDRQTIHAHDDRTAEPHVHQHQAGARRR